MATEHQTPVLIVGGGPSGLIVALQLARHGIHCMLVERNLDTTKWPKMDITNCRSMELFNRLGISDGLREQGVGQDYSFDVLFSTGLSEGGQLICKWDLPSPNAWTERIKSHNDGSMPREPYQRCSQAIFEAWLKRRIQAEPYIVSKFGFKFESLLETEGGVTSTITDVATGNKHTVHSQYVIGCDGAGSRVRNAIGAQLIGGPVPMALFLVHFKSRDLTALQKQGHFWHIFFTHGGVIIAQDEIDTWTVHLPIPLDVDWQALDPEKAIYDVLGGSVGPYAIKVDEILVKSAWRPNICIADQYASSSRRVFIAGDAAHQNIPTGGYGMNTAIGDSFDISWKLAAVLNGYGGQHLLDSYEAERKPVAIRNIERSGVHHKLHQDCVAWATQAGPGMVSASDDDGRALRTRIANHVLLHDGENKDHGIEMDYRYNGSPVVVAESETTEPQWNYRDYVPSTWPGARVPQLFLADGKTSVYDLFGPGYTIVDFSVDGHWAAQFVKAAAHLKTPMCKVHIPSEKHVRDVWARDAVLVRPDDHVAWRAPLNRNVVVDIEEILKIAIGQKRAPSEKRVDHKNADGIDRIRKEGFTSTIGIADQSKVEMLAEFQK